MTPQVWVVWYGGGLLGIYDNAAAANRVAEARNEYARTHHVGKRGTMVPARVELWDVQSAPLLEDL